MNEIIVETLIKVDFTIKIIFKLFTLLWSIYSTTINVKTIVNVLQLNIQWNSYCTVYLSNIKKQ